MKRTVTLDGREMALENNALLPRRYRHIFGRDLVVDMNALVKAYQNKDQSQIPFDLLEDVIWIMLREAGEEVGTNTEEWLASIDDVFGVYALASDVFTLWAEGRKTTSIPKKK